MEGPDAIALRQFFDSARFRSGVCRGKWRLVKLEFPIALVEVRCPDGRWLGMRFECTGYPHSLPNGVPWDCGAGTRLTDERWPRGQRISPVFNPGWKGGNALYIPCDRESIIGHDQWLQDHPELVWDPSRGLEVYLEGILSVLDSPDFSMKAP